MPRWLERLLHTHDSPRRTASAFALGVFFGFSPLLGLHAILGVAFAFLLIGLLAYFQWRKTREEGLAREARQQTQEILGTVKEGLFLLEKVGPDPLDAALVTLLEGLENQAVNS